MTMEQQVGFFLMEDQEAGDLDDQDNLPEDQRHNAKFPPSLPKKPLSTLITQLSPMNPPPTVSSEYRDALNRSVQAFIYYVLTTSKECAKDKKRVTVRAEDVRDALKEIGFDEIAKELATRALNSGMLGSQVLPSNLDWQHWKKTGEKRYQRKPCW